MTHIVGIETRGRDVLAALDRRVTTSFYWSLTLLATLGGFLFGYDTAKFLPETKNRSVEEVVQIFEQEAQGGQGASGSIARGSAAA